MSELSSLVDTLEQYSNLSKFQRPVCLKFIKNYSQFIDALKKINSLVGLKEAKYKVYLLVQSFIINYKLEGVPVHNEKLNVFLCGSSGCGKTIFGSYLAQLFAASGCLKEKTNDVFDFGEPRSDKKDFVLKREKEKFNFDIDKINLTNKVLTYRKQIAQTDITIMSLLTNFNNIRKKIKAKNNDDTQLQMKLQKFKINLKSCLSSNADLTLNALKDLMSKGDLQKSVDQILPITIPKNPGQPNTFDSNVGLILSGNCSCKSNSSTCSLCHSGQSGQDKNTLPICPEPEKEKKIDDKSEKTALSDSTESALSDECSEKTEEVESFNIGPPVPQSLAPPPLPEPLPEPLQNSGEKITNDSPQEEKEEDLEVKFVVLTRGDLVGKYQGHTEDRIRKILNKYIGGVILFDEAYTLISGSSDDYGQIIMSELVNFMTQHERKIIFMFAGYKESMKSLFNMQPGLQRRIEIVINIEDYTSDELAQIFINQLEMVNLKCNTIETKLKELFKARKEHFPNFGGSTEIFAKFVKQAIFSNSSLLQDALNDSVSKQEFEKFRNVTMEKIEEAYEHYINNSVTNVYKDKNPMLSYFN